MHPKFTDIHTGGTPMPPLKEEQILEAIASGDQPATDIARRAGMSILELAAHVCTPRNLEALGRVKQLHAIEREMLLGRLKRKALLRLEELTDEVPAGSADEIRAFEVMRRACADLLRYGGVNTEKSHSEPGGPKARGYHPEPITPAFEAEVLEALERLGEEANQYEPRARVCGPVERVPWSKAQPQATSGGDVVEEVEVTQEVQVGMAFGKTSDHGTESMHTRTRRVPPVQEGPLRTRMRRVPLEETPPLQPLRSNNRPRAGWERECECEHGGCRAPPLPP